MFFLDCKTVVFGRFRKAGRCEAREPHTPAGRVRWENDCRLFIQRIRSKEAPYNVTEVIEIAWTSKLLQRRKMEKLTASVQMARTVGVVFSLCFLFTVRLKHLANWKLCFSPKQTAEISGFFQARRQHTKNIFSSEKRFHSFLLLRFQNNPKLLASPSKSTSSVFPRASGFPVKLIRRLYLFDEGWLTFDDRLRQD